jgi:hypothetical protein
MGIARALHCTDNLGIERLDHRRYCFDDWPIVVLAVSLFNGLLEAEQFTCNLSKFVLNLVKILEPACCLQVD